MTDILIRNIAEADLAPIASRAGRLGLSRGEYLRRRITADAATSEETLTIDALQRFADLAGDLLGIAGQPIERL